MTSNSVYKLDPQLPQKKCLDSIRIGTPLLQGRKVGFDLLVDLSRISNSVVGLWRTSSDVKITSGDYGIGCVCAAGPLKVLGLAAPQRRWGDSFLQVDLLFGSLGSGKVRSLE